MNYIRVSPRRQFARPTRASYPALRSSMDQPIHANAEPIPGYRLLERLGRGGFGEVWKAEAPGGMHKAIKFVFGDMESAGDDGKGAEQEYRSLHRVKTIRHPFILSLERFDIINGQLVIVMELADRNLWDRYSECLKEGLPGIPRAELLAYLEEAAEALDLMNIHHQIQHLDIKPQNLFLVHRHVKVADFGLAKDLEGARAKLTGGITPVYASPETFDGWLSRQSDQYSLAIVYQEMLTGRRPFNGISARQLVLQHTLSPPDVSALSSGDGVVVAKALAKKPDERFVTCTDFIRALMGEVAASPVPVNGTRSAIASNSPVAMPTATTPKMPSDSATKPARPGLPALKTQGSKLITPTTRTTLSNANADSIRVTPAPTPVEEVGSGALFPTLLIGLGGTGLLVLRALRQLLVERFGRPTLPHLRWLYIDTNPGCRNATVGDASGIALSADEVLATPVRRPSYYLSRDGMPSVDTWLSQEDLFRIPKSPATEGVRGIGRLALCDHYHIVCQRLRVSLEQLLNADRLRESDRMTNLGIRSTFPRVVLATSLAGGTGGGMFLDLGYLVRREARKLGIANAKVIGLLGVPAYSVDASDGRGIANARASLTELRHYSHNGTVYQARFDTREPTLEESSPPFAMNCLFRLPTRSNSQELAQCAEAAAQIAYVELLSPIGRMLHPDTPGMPGSATNLIGIARLGWPRLKVIGVSAWLLARHTLRTWVEKEESRDCVAARTAIDAAIDELHLNWLKLRAHSDEYLDALPSGPSEPRIDAILAKVASAELTPKIGFGRMVKILGCPGKSIEDDAAELPIAVNAKLRDLCTHCVSRMRAVVMGLMEQPGVRLEGVERALVYLDARLQDEFNRAARELKVRDDQTNEAAEPIRIHIETLGMETGPSVRRWPATEAIPQLRTWAAAVRSTLIPRAATNLYQTLLGMIPDLFREMKSVRNQLAEFERQLTEAVPQACATIAGGKSIFPDGSTSVAEAARKLTEQIGPDETREFEHSLQGKIRHEVRSLSHVCSRPTEIGKVFIALLLDHAKQFLGSRVPMLPTVRAIAMSPSSPEELEDRVALFVAAAAPALLGPNRHMKPTVAVLGIPPDETSTSLIDLVKEECPGCKLMTTATIDEVLLVREIRDVSLAALPHLSVESSVVRLPNERPIGSTHSRTDVAWQYSE